MAKKDFTFAASIKLQTKEFRKGIKEVQKSLNTLKRTFTNALSGIGLGLGLSSFVKSMKDTAVALNSSQIVLRNVSKEYGEFGENMYFLRRIAKDYGQDLIVLTNNFAQFRAAAESSNLSLDDMRKIYESLTRAAGAYQLSADQSNNMMLAVTQMMSKGKVAAEELRRQFNTGLTA